jgi:hypothetical protein
VTNEHPVAERERMLREGAELFAQLQHLLDARSDESSLHADGASAWTSRDVYAHFARWTGFTIEQVQRKSAGIDWLPPIPGTDDEINERWAAEDRALTTAQAKAWCVESAEHLRLLMRGLSADQWSRFGRKCMEDIGGGHYRAHIEFIEGAQA